MIAVGEVDAHHGAGGGHVDLVRVARGDLVLDDEGRAVEPHVGVADVEEPVLLELRVELHAVESALEELPGRVGLVLVERLVEDLAVLDDLDDAGSLALVGLVRSGVHVGVSDLGDFFWARPLSPDAAAGAAREMTGYDEDRALLDSAVKVAMSLSPATS